MKKITFWLFALFSTWQISAQVSSYVFSQTSGTYTPITGGLVLGTTTSDEQKYVDPATLAGGTVNTGVGFPIGFNFTFNGQVFDRVAVNNNGWISLGQSALTPSVDINSTSAYTPLASVVANTPVLLRNRIAGIAADLQGQTGSSIRIETIGAAPNRVLVVQWTNYKIYDTSGTGQNLSFQIRLNETVNTVDVVYDALTFNATSNTAQIGLGGVNASDFDNRTTTTNWNTTTSGATNAATCTFVTTTVVPPTSGLTFTWTLGPACTGMPNAVTSLPASMTALPTQVIGNIVVSDYTPDTSGFAFQWQQSLDNGVTWANATGGSYANTAAFTAPNFAGVTIQYRLSVTCTATSSTAFSTVTTIQACGAYSVPVLEPLTTFLPTCWQEADNGDLAAGPAILLSGSWLVDGFANAGTTGAARVTLDAAADNDWVISPLFTIPVTGYELKFDAAATQSGATTAPTTAWESDDFVQVLVSTAMNNWTVLYTYNDINVPPNTGSANIIDLDAYAGQTVRFAYRAVEGAVNGAASVDFFIDNFQIRLTPVCSEPSGIVSAGATDTSVNMSWTAPAIVPAVGYEYIVSTSNTVPTVNGTATTATFATPTGLLSNTTYYIFVRSVCASGVYSSWTGPVTFTTACAAFSVPLLEPFTTFLPSVCWSNMVGGDLTTGPTTTTGSGWVADGFANVGATGAFKNEIWFTGANDWMISPRLTIPATGYELRFDAAATQFASVNAPTTAWESDDFIEVLVSTTGMTNWTPVFTYDSSNQPSNTGSPNIIDLDAYAGQNIRIAFRAVEGTTNGAADIDFSIDNFQIRLTPTCIEPINLIAVASGSSTANVSWDATSPIPVAGYEYFVSTANTIPVAAGTATTATFAILSGLLPQTTYYVFVRANCGAGDFSAWTGPISFTTACSPITTLPWNEGFEGVATVGTTNFPPCWFKENGVYSTALAGAYNTPHTGTKYLRDQYGANNDYMWTPGFNLVAGTSYDFSSFIQGDNGTSWTVAYFVNSSQISTGATQLGATYTVPGSGTSYSPQSYNYVSRSFVPITSGTYYFAVRVNEPTFGPWYVAFDDFELKLSPACPTPSASATGVTNAVATLSWAAVPSATLGYEYVLNNVATDPTGAGIATTALTYGATGLAQTTVYYFHIRSVCAAGTYSTWSTTSFTTPATPPVNDNCSGSIAITLDDTFCNGTNNNGTNAGSTDSGVTNPACFNYGLKDVWFSVAIPANVATINVSTDFTGGTLVDTEIELYSGVCGTLVEVACDQDSGTTILSNGSSYNSLITNAVVTGGQTYYVRVSGYDATAVGTFCLKTSTNTLGTDNFNNKSFTVYPNPVKNVLNIEYTENISKVQVINLLGQEVITKSVNATQNQIDMSGLAAGTYLVKVTSEDLVKTIKIIKQ